MLARLTRTHWLPIVIIWIIVGAVILVLAPSLSQVGVTTETAHLPADSESARATTILKEQFARAPDESAGSAFIIVFNPDKLTAQDFDNARRLNDWLVSPESPPAIKQVMSIFGHEELRPVLVSQDGTAMLLNIQLSADPMSQSAGAAVEDIRAQIRAISGNTTMYLSGDTGLSHDLLDSITQTVDKTTLVTIILVIVLLLIIYRSPVAILVPLITIGMSFIVARGILGYMAAAGVEISSLLEAYLVVTIFGVGTDYCLFMVSRFKEELAGSDRGSAGEHAFRRIGPVIAASAITVIIAFLCLGVSSFSSTRIIGYALAVGVATTLIAGLTLTPALISLFGSKLFWPLKLDQPAPERDTGLNWRKIGRQVVKRPALMGIPIIVILALPYIQLASFSTSADFFSQMPAGTESVKGIQVLRGHFPSGEYAPFQVLIESPDDLTAPGSQQALRDAAASIAAVPGVTRADYSSAPSAALDSWADNVHGILVSLPAGLTQLRSLEPLGAELRSLAISYPGAVQSQNFSGAGADMAKIAGLAQQLATPADAMRLLPDFSAALRSLEAKLRALAGEFRLETATPFTAWLRETYFSRDGRIARLAVIPATDPYSRENTELAVRLRDAMPGILSSNNLSGSTSYVGGEGARLVDIIQTSDSDFLRVMLLVSLSILVVVIILLRSLLAPLYMVATVLLNFGATLGISSWLFLNVLKQENIIYLLPIFVFVILVAVGADYNIFLVSRIKEEAEKRPLKEAVSEAVARTGGIITACGIILAGTFAALLSAPLQLVFQIGAAIALGIIIDTFLVRAILIPSLVSIAGKRSWWPSGLYRSLKRKKTAD